jgi:hypothetical protein
MPIHFGQAPADAVLLRPPVDAARFAANKSWAREQRPTIMTALKSGQHVGIEFSGATYTTQTAMHALLHEPIAQLGLPGLANLHFVRASPQIEGVIRLVANYALAQPDAALENSESDDQ